jgi:hypothetical protein
MEANLAQACIAACLFSTDKYRKAADLLDRFDDALAGDVRNSERAYRQLNLTITHEPENMSRADLVLVRAGLSAFADDQNRKMQILNDRGQPQDAALIQHGLRDVYAALSKIEAMIDLNPVAA